LHENYYFLIKKENMDKTAIIIGAGPAGLTAAFELITKTDIKPVIIEKCDYVGGISRTVVYKGNRMDIGGHRFFSKSDMVMKWWLGIFPLQGLNNSKNKNPVEISRKKRENMTAAPDPGTTDRVMLVRNRLSRIFFLRKFFDYPVTFNLSTLHNLGFVRIIKIGWTYFWIRIFPVKNVKSLEDFFINRFGAELYKTFFKDYTEKVWGVPCKEISSDWGAQRIKELSVSKAVFHAIKAVFIREKSIEQKNTETSLIEKFLYPKYGPGQLWETVASIIEEKGGIIIKNSEIIKIKTSDNKITEVSYISNSTEEVSSINGDYFFSSMPVKDLIEAIEPDAPGDVKEVSNGLQYRDFITVGLLLNKLLIKNETEYITSNGIIPDNWIYIQERDVKVGRLQIFNNWSPYMVADKSKVWIGLEYFCNEGDELWQKPDELFIQFAIDELHKIGIIDKNEVIDSTLIRMPKTYPAYFGTYSRFDIIKNYTNGFENLFLIGRNGMHKYNNQDHSMLTAIMAVDNIISEKKTKENIWNINTDLEYHEEK
jgi:protoporphyrinogen oxidase